MKGKRKLDPFLKRILLLMLAFSAAEVLRDIFMEGISPWDAICRMAFILLMIAIGATIFIFGLLGPMSAVYAFLKYKAGEIKSATDVLCEMSDFMKDTLSNAFNDKKDNTKTGGSKNG